MSDPEPSFFERVWAVVARIPPGRVTTYGDIAAHLGRRGAARTVGWALNDAVGTDLPCHRVVNRNGGLISPRHSERCHYPVPTTVGDTPGTWMDVNSMRAQMSAVPPSLKVVKGGRGYIPAKAVGTESPSKAWLGPGRESSWESGLRQVRAPPL